MAPRDLNHALSLMRAYERHSQVLDDHTTATPTKPVRSPQRPSVPITTTQPTVPSTANATPQRPFKKLTPVQMAERRKKGLCYNCDEQYVHGHRCPRLFYLEVTDFEEDVSTEEVAEETELVISLHALTCIRSEDTMQIQVQMKGKVLTALLETGSTHNFVKLNIVLSLRLEVCSSRGRIAVANGDKIDCHGLANSVRLSIGPYIFTMDAYAIPLDSFDIILGVEFLRTLGPILWDLANMSMAF
jgi:hypothetical protein